MPLRRGCVLVVDDDAQMLRMMRSILEMGGYRVLTVSNGEAALDMFDQEIPDLVLLDIMMAGTDGYAVCQRIREFSKVPIVAVTAKSADQDRVKMLDAGADDYITKPFSSNELMARVRAVLRRVSLQNDVQPVFRCHNLTIDFAHHCVSLRGNQVDLTRTEYSVLCYLALNAGRVVTSDQILEKVWGEEYIGSNHLLQVNIGRIRHKLGHGSEDGPYVVTKRGIGYMMVNAEAPRSAAPL